MDVEQRFVSWNLIEAIEHEVERSSLSAACRLQSEHRAEESEGHVSWRVFESYLEDLVAEVGDSAFGIQAGAHVSRGTFHALEYVFRTSPDLGRAIRRAAQFTSILTGMQSFHLSPSEEGLRIQYDCPLSGHPAEFLYTDFVFSAVCSLFRSGTGRQLRLQIELRRPAPVTLAPYREALSSVPEFGMPTNSILIEEDDLDDPMLEADEVLCRIVQERVLAEAEKASLEAPTHTAIRRYLSKHLVDAPGIEQVATALGLGVRTLQSQLAAEGWSFQDVLDTLRRELSEAYLARPELSIAEVAFLLGYGEASSFVRAFKRWHQMTPGAYRQASPL